MHITNNFISKLKLPDSSIKQKRYYDDNPCRNYVVNFAKNRYFRLLGCTNTIAVACTPFNNFYTGLKLTSVPVHHLTSNKN